MHSSFLVHSCKIFSAALAVRRMKSLSHFCKMFLQQGLPPMLPDPKNGGNQHKNVLSHYERLTKTGNPRRWAVLIDDYISILTKPISLVCGAWDRRDVFSFQHALITAIAHWKRIAAESGACPISFTNLEMELHETEMELLEGLGKIMHQLQDENMIPFGGMVQPEHYEQAKNMSNRFKEFFISLEEDDQQRTLYPQVCPYQDT